MYSFSKLETFNNCKRAYYYTYVLGEKGNENIYSYCGTIVHELTQGIIQGYETNESAVKKFHEAIEDAEMLDLPWVSEKIKNNYVECITHFLENYAGIKNNTIRIEDYFEVEIEGHIFRGYIDLWYRVGNKIYIFDLKTSTKYSNKELPKKARQLVLYAIALNEKYPEYDIILQFNMMKYVLKNGKLVERNKLDLFDEYENDGLVEIKFTEEAREDFHKYVRETMNKINSLDENDILYWGMDNDPRKDFFCIHLCGHRPKCLERLGVLIE